MSDLNGYVWDKLLVYMDDVHVRIKTDLTRVFGAAGWFQQGIIARGFIKPEVLANLRKRIESPLSVANMDQQIEESYGVEHINQIFEHHWKNIFKVYFDDQQRTLVLLKQIAEVRHSLAHRRRRHTLRVDDAIIALRNMGDILTGLKSENGSIFKQDAHRISTGSNLWGSELSGSLPNSGNIYKSWVNRKSYVTNLLEWINDDIASIMLTGYGGAGKSAIAYHFADSLKRNGQDGFLGVSWVSAKQKEFATGESKFIAADFHDKSTFKRAVLCNLQEIDAVNEISDDDFIKELNELPSLIVIDDFDTVIQSNDTKLQHFLLRTLESTGCKMLYTSRVSVAGIQPLEVIGLDDNEFADFIGVYGRIYGLNHEEINPVRKRIQTVTQNMPLFIVDLLRYSKQFGLNEGIRVWESKKGDAAREYALKSQIDGLVSLAQDAIKSLTVANRPLTPSQIGQIAGVTEDDAVVGINQLMQFSLVIKDVDRGDYYRLLNNTSRLSQKIYKDDVRLASLKRNWNNQQKGESNLIQTQIRTISNQAETIAKKETIELGANYIRRQMINDLANNGTLYGKLGHIYSKNPVKYYVEAKSAFMMAQEYSTNSVLPYIHWIDLEIAQARMYKTQPNLNAALDCWNQVKNISLFCIDYFDNYDYFNIKGADAMFEQGEIYRDLNRLTDARSYWNDSITLSKRVLESTKSIPDQPYAKVDLMNQAYSLLVKSYDNMDVLLEVVNALNQWRQFAIKEGHAQDCYSEATRIHKKYPTLRGRLVENVRLRNYQVLR